MNSDVLTHDVTHHVGEHSGVRSTAESRLNNPKLQPHRPAMLQNIFNT